MAAVATHEVPGHERAVACAVCGGRETTTVAARTTSSRWVVCRGCGLVFQSPRVDHDDVAARYLDGDYHRRRGGVPEHYVQYSLRRSRAALAWGLDAAHVMPSVGSAYDIGCGIGGALVALRERGFAVQGVEPDPQLSAVARDRFGLDVVTGLFDRSTLHRDDVAFAYSCHVWEHLADPVATARQAHALLAARLGYLLIVVPTYRHARSLAWQYMNPDHTYLYSHVSLANVLRAAGFTIVDHAYRHGADSELWMLARALPEYEAGYGWQTESVASVQAALATVPLLTPLGVPGRVRTHVETLVRDPADFVGRATRAVGRRLGRGGA